MEKSQRYFQLGAGFAETSIDKGFFNFPSFDTVEYGSHAGVVSPQFRLCHIAWFEWDLRFSVALDTHSKLGMANRAPSLDPHVFSIRDLKREGSKRLPPGYRGEQRFSRFSQ